MKIRLLALAFFISAPNVFGLNMKAEEKAQANTYQPLAQALKQMLTNEQVRTQFKILITDMVSRGQLTPQIKEQALALLNLLNEGLSVDWTAAKAEQDAMHSRNVVSADDDTIKKMGTINAQINALRAKAQTLNPATKLQNSKQIDPLIAAGKRELTFTINLVDLQTISHEIDDLQKQVTALWGFDKPRVQHQMSPAVKALLDWQEKIMNTMMGFMQAVSATVDFTELSKFLVKTGIDALTTPIPGVVMPASAQPTPTVPAAAKESAQKTGGALYLTRPVAVWRDGAHQAVVPDK